MISSLRLAGPMVAMIFVCRMFDDSLHRNERATYNPAMHESVRGRAKRVLVVGASSDEHGVSPHAALAPDGMLIVMEERSRARGRDAPSLIERRHSARDAPSSAAIPGGCLYKLAGPFDVIFCDQPASRVRPMLETTARARWSAHHEWRHPSSPTTSSSKNVADALERIAELNPTLNAFITVFEADAMAQARVLDEELRQGRSRGPLHGRTISIKDLIDVKGVPTTAASRVRAGHIAARRRAGRGPSARGRRGHHRQNQPSRVRARARRATNRHSVPCGTLTTRADRQEARAAALARPWPPEWDGRRSAPTPAARFAFRRPHAASSG